MNFQRMDYFLAVAECLNFSKAADQLYISHQALSKQIRLLEDEIGARLLERDTTKVRLTEVGRKVVELYTPLSAAIKQCTDSIQAFVEYKKTCIRVGYFNGLPYRTAVAPVVAYLREKIPGVKIDIAAAGFSEIKEDLAEDRIDLLIHVMHEWDEWPEVISKTMCELPEHIIVSELHPWFDKDSVTAEDIRQERMLCYEESFHADKHTFMGHIEVLERLYVRNASTYAGVLASGAAFGIVGSLHNQSEGEHKLLPLPPEYSVRADLTLSYKPLHPQMELFSTIPGIQLSE